MMLKSFRISSVVRGAVGSSITMILLLSISARAISTICFSAIDSSDTGRAGSIWKSMLFMNPENSSDMPFQSTVPLPVVRRRPRKAFSTVDRVGTRFSSWNTRPTPPAMASRVPEKRTGAPSMRISPLSAA